jgi:hypothetical protein
MPGTIEYVKTNTAPMYEGETGGKSVLHLLWGDQVEVLEEAGDRVTVRARGRDKFGWVEKKALGGKSLLELYVVDVGQGDGMLIKTPNGRHLMIDGGLRRDKQDTGKSAADFVDWKFFKDYGTDRIALDAIVVSHCDADHYGGVIDLLGVDETHELDCEEVRVENIYHAGIGRWKNPKGGSWLGPHDTGEGGKDFFTQLVGDRTAIAAALEKGADPALTGEWADFMQAATEAHNAEGESTSIERISNATGHLPGYETAAGGEPSIRVLGPLQGQVGNETGVRRYDDEDSINTNGNSVVLMLDCGSCRMLLTGDLNRASQEALLEHYAGEPDAFRCDVGKACHHGSKEVSFSFLKAMEPAVTVFSSGDNEGYDHPRPTIMAASAINGYLEMDGDEPKSPLLYSTELARSVKLGKVEGSKVRVVTGLIYGLVNVRTDGDKILCATRDEQTLKWRTEEINTRFKPA